MLVFGSGLKASCGAGWGTSWRPVTGCGVGGTSYRLVATFLLAGSGETGVAAVAEAWAAKSGPRFCVLVMVGLESSEAGEAGGMFWFCRGFIGDGGMSLGCGGFTSGSSSSRGTVLSLTIG